MENHCMLTIFSNISSSPKNQLLQKSSYYKIINMGILLVNAWKTEAFSPNVKSFSMLVYIAITCIYYISDVKNQVLLI